MAEYQPVSDRLVAGTLVVGGGGDTAIDAARVARRLAAESTVLYRRTKAEMPAEAIHELITGEPVSSLPRQEIMRHEKMKLSYYEAKQKVAPKRLSPEESIKRMGADDATGLSQEEVIVEAKRCLSCGLCFECGSCRSFCQDNAIHKPVIKGQRYNFKLKFCNGCKKCAENCPCGHIEMH